MYVLKMAKDVSVGALFRMGSDNFMMLYQHEGLASTCLNVDTNTPINIDSGVVVVAPLTFKELDNGAFFVIDSDDSLDDDRGAVYKKLGISRYSNIQTDRLLYEDMSSRSTKLDQEVTPVTITWRVANDSQ